LRTSELSTNDTFQNIFLTNRVVWSSMLWHCWLGGRKGIRTAKNWVVDAGVVICLGRGADFHIAQLILLPLSVSCSRKSRLVLVLPFWYQLTWVVPHKIQRAIKLLLCSVVVSMVPDLLPARQLVLPLLWSWVFSLPHRQCCSDHDVTGQANWKSRTKTSQLTDTITSM